MRYALTVLPKLGPVALNQHGAVLGSHYENSRCTIHHPEEKHWISRSGESLALFTEPRVKKSRRFLFWRWELEEQFRGIVDEVHGLNDSGVVAATVRFGLSFRHAALIDDGIVADFASVLKQTLGLAESRAISCNNHGCLLINAGRSAYFNEIPVLWDGRQLRSLEGVFGRGGNTRRPGSLVKQVNDLGHVGGTIISANKRHRAMVFRDELKLELEQPEAEGASSFRAMNSTGLSVGTFLSWSEPAGAAMARDMAVLDEAARFDAAIADAGGPDITDYSNEVDGSRYFRDRLEFESAHPEIRRNLAVAQVELDPRVNSPTLPCFWEPNGKRRELEVLTAFDSGVSVAVNNHGYSVGYLMRTEKPETGSRLCHFSRMGKRVQQFSAVLWATDGTATKLDTLLPEGSNLALTSAVAINDAGQILCSAREIADTADADDPIGSVAVLLTPIA